MLLNPNIESRNPKQYLMTKIQMTKTMSFEILNIRILNLFSASDFVFRTFI